MNNSYAAWTLRTPNRRILPTTTAIGDADDVRGARDVRVYAAQRKPVASGAAPVGWGQTTRPVVLVVRAPRHVGGRIGWNKERAARSARGTRTARPRHGV